MIASAGWCQWRDAGLLKLAVVDAVASIGICLIAAKGVLVLLLDRRASPR